MDYDRDPNRIFYDEELPVLQKRFSIRILLQQPKMCIFYILYQPEEDFPFSLSKPIQIHFTFQDIDKFPKLSILCGIGVFSPDFPQPITTKVEKALMERSKVYKGRPEIVSGLMRWLTHNLESLLVDQTITEKFHEVKVTTPIPTTISNKIQRRPEPTQQPIRFELIPGKQRPQDLPPRPLTVIPLPGQDSKEHEDHEEYDEEYHNTESEDEDEEDEEDEDEDEEEEYGEEEDNSTTTTSTTINNDTNDTIRLPKKGINIELTSHSLSSSIGVLSFTKIEVVLSCRRCKYQRNIILLSEFSKSKSALIPSTIPTTLISTPSTDTITSSNEINNNSTPSINTSQTECNVNVQQTNDSNNNIEIVSQNPINTSTTTTTTTTSSTTPTTSSTTPTTSSTTPTTSSTTPTTTTTSSTTPTTTTTSSTTTLPSFSSTPTSTPTSAPTTTSNDNKDNNNNNNVKKKNSKNNNNNREDIIRCGKCTQTSGIARYYAHTIYGQEKGIGIVQVTGGWQIGDIVFGWIEISCFNCSNTIQIEKSSFSRKFYPVCNHCHSSLQFTLNGFQLVPFGKSEEGKKIRKKNPSGGERIQLKVGTPLPSKGTCKHYSKSYRWFRFPCCQKLFPCDVCHDNNSDHESTWASRVICGHCSKEQNCKGDGKNCSNCGSSFSSNNSTRYWEGGSGCRNKMLMNRKDNHKYTNSKMKTTSKKFQRVGPKNNRI